MVAPAEEAYKFDKYGAQPYPDDLYHYGGIAPASPASTRSGRNTWPFCRDHGNLVINDTFTSDEVAAALDGLLDLIDGKDPEFRGVQFEARARALVGTMPRERKQDIVRKLQNYVSYDARLKAMAEHPRLLQVVGQLLGERPALFANQAMLKPPLIGREKPWHQDQAFFNVPVTTKVVGAWIALDEALPENGCMHIVPDHHRQPIVHFQRRDWQICDEHMPRDGVMAVPLQPGGVLFFDSFLPHGTPTTHSSKRRRALQLHYSPAGVERGHGEERLAVFGNEGKEVACP